MCDAGACAPQVVVNKADGDLRDAAGRAASEYANALRLLHPLTADWVPEVLTCSSLEGAGISQVWDRIGDFHQIVVASGAFETKRAEQARRWMWGEVDENLLSAFRRHPNVRKKLSELEAKVASSRLTPSAAAQILLTAFRSTE